MKKFKKGDKVIRYLNLAGFTTNEEETVLKVTKKGIWLDNGVGNDPSGPFDLKTGKLLGIDPMFGTSYIRGKHDSK